MRKVLTDEEKKERKRLYMKKRYEANKEIILEKQKISDKKCSNRIKEYKKQYEEIHKEERKQYLKDYKTKNREQIREQQRDYLNNYCKNYSKERRENDPLYKMTSNMRSRIYSFFKANGYKKESRTHEILGCSYDELKQHLESQFTEWMNWENYGKPNDNIYELNKTWDIDHIIPLSSAKNEKELLELCEFTNLQPLCSYTNRWVKSDNI